MLPDGQHAAPHLGSDFFVLEVLAIGTRRPWAHLGTGADDVDTKDRSAWRFSFCGRDTGVVPAVGNNATRYTVKGSVPLVLVRNEVRVAMADGAAV